MKPFQICSQRTLLQDPPHIGDFIGTGIVVPRRSARRCADVGMFFSGGFAQLMDVDRR